VTVTAQPKTRRGRETRDRIVDCAAELVAARGVEHTSLDDVLAAAGASKSQLYHYFEDRDALVEAAVERRCAQALEQLTATLAGIESLAELEERLEQFVRLFEQSLAGCPIGSLAGEVVGRHEGAWRKVESAFATWEASFAGLFERMRERGELRADADPAILATVLLAALEGGQLLGQTRRNGMPLRIAIAAAIDYARRLGT
jgi:TetR/AcrR family transcriptional repressor of nem operon